MKRKKKTYKEKWMHDGKHGHYDQVKGYWVNADGTRKYPATQPVEVTKFTAGRDATKFKLIIPRAIMDKIQWWMHKTDKEVSGFGSLIFDEAKNSFLVEDVMLLKQSVTGASAEIDANAMGKAMYQMKDKPLGLKWHWHSHVNMGVFWSADDMEIIRSLGQQGWILASVFNYKEESKSAYLTTVKVPNPNGGEIPHDIFVDNIETNVINFVPAEDYQAWDKEYADNVESKVYKPSPLSIGEPKDKNEAPGSGILPAPQYWTWNEDGYVKERVYVNNIYTWIYNPCRDLQLKTLDQVRSVILYQTSDSEHKLLMATCPDYKAVFDKIPVDEIIEASESYKLEDELWLGTEGTEGMLNEYGNRI